MSSLKRVKESFLKSGLNVTELADKSGIAREHLYYLLGDYAKTIDTDEYCKLMVVLSEGTPYNVDTVTGATLQLISDVTEQINKLSLQVQKATADRKLTEQEKLLISVTLDNLYDRATESINDFRKMLKGAR